MSGAAGAGDDGDGSVIGSVIVGSVLELEVGPVAHGGFCVARHEGRVVFVRHTLPGERVLATVTEGKEGDRFWRADATKVLQASAGRVQPRCPYSGPGRCGGCDWQHASLQVQRRMKADVVAEQLRRLAGLDVAVEVEPVAGDRDGLDWRTRVQLSVDAEGRLGLRKHRSHEVVPVRHCPIAVPAVDTVIAARDRWDGCSGVEVVVPSRPGEEPLVLLSATVDGDPAESVLSSLPAEASVARLRPGGRADSIRGRAWVQERTDVGGQQRDFRVSGSGFWQVHPGAAGALVQAVLEALRPQAGERALDLYCGVGLFAAALAVHVGDQGGVIGIESDPRAVADARRNLHDLPAVRVERGRVEQVLERLGLDAPGEGPDLVVLDPPRTGAGRRVVRTLTALGPRAIAYVACDPAALARDVATAAQHGYRLAGLRAFDQFPMTHHVECVALLVPGEASSGVALLEPGQ